VSSGSALTERLKAAQVAGFTSSWARNICGRSTVSAGSRSRAAPDTPMRVWASACPAVTL